MICLIIGNRVDWLTGGPYFGNNQEVMEIFESKIDGTKAISDASFEADVLQAEKPVLVLG